jgi:serine/threonine protein phosphatase PrpC
MGLISAGKCDIGRKRKTNQDSIYLNPEKNIFVVADGMGGHNGGDIASAMAVKHVPDFLIQHYDMDPIQASVRTVVTLYFKGQNLYCTNVGDSRTYLVNKKRLFQLSKDHSLVQEKLNMGIYDREQAAKDPQKNVLVRTVGFDDKVDVDVWTYKVSKNDIFLGCSDGLHGKVSDEDIVFIINKFIPDPGKATKKDVEHCAQFLIDQANRNGGNDNISVIIVLAQ